MHFMMTILTIILLLLLSSFDVIHAASSCYSCNPCGTTWNPGVTSIIRTTSPTDYCRKTVTGSLVVKDSTSTCNPVNVLNNGVYCCQTDYCNTANKYSSYTIHTVFFMIFIRIIY